MNAKGKAGRPPHIEKVRVVATQIPREHYEWLLRQGPISTVLREMIKREVEK